MFVRKNLDTFQPQASSSSTSTSSRSGLLFTTFRRIESWVFRHLDLLPSTWVEGSGFVADIAVIIFAAVNSEFCYAYSPRNTEMTVTARNGHGETVARPNYIHMSTIWMVQKWDTNGTLPAWYKMDPCTKVATWYQTTCVDQVCGESLIVASSNKCPKSFITHHLLWEINIMISTRDSCSKGINITLR